MRSRCPGGRVGSTRRRGRRLGPRCRHARRGCPPRRSGQVTNVRWVQALAEQIPELDLGTFRLVTFGQSFHRTDRERVADAIYDLLEPGGASLFIAPTVEGRPKPPGPGYPELSMQASSPPGPAHRPAPRRTSLRE